MADEQEIDDHLVAVLNQVLDAVYQAKQAAWSASTSSVRDDLRDLVAFLIDQSGLFMVAEEGLGGRSADVSSPSSHQRGNLVAEANDDHGRAVSLLADRITTIVHDARTRAAAIGDAREAHLLSELADGLETRAQRLRPS